VVVHAINYVPVTLVGLYYFWKRQITLKEVESEVEDPIDNEDMSGFPEIS